MVERKTTGNDCYTFFLASISDEVSYSLQLFGDHITKVLLLRFTTRTEINRTLGADF
jgi:hypothetical protein